MGISPSVECSLLVALLASKVVGKCMPTPLRKEGDKEIREDSEYGYTETTQQKQYSSNDFSIVTRHPKSYVGIGTILDRKIAILSSS